MFTKTSIWTGLISGGISQVGDTTAFIRGDQDRADYMKNTAENVAGTAGVIAGIDYGAILGTMICPGVGTIIGSVAGGLLGDRFGRGVVQTTTNLFSPRNDEPVKTQPVTH